MTAIGEPFSAVISAAISADRLLYSSWKRVTVACRSSGVSRGHGPLSNASRAAATAASTSAAVACGTVPTSDWSCGEWTSMISEPAGATQWPPMKSWS